MNFKKLNRLIEERRILTSMSSLPFIVTKNGENMIAWFNFDVNQSNIKATSHISTIFVLNDAMSMEKNNVSIIVDLNLQECDETTLDETNYILKLEELYNDFNRENVVPLISQAVIAPLLLVYIEVIKIIETNKN